ncbi:MAG: hypothetical protein RLZZ91_501 [Bacteroidota bacterium]|jgi:hypothetical protein
MNRFIFSNVIFALLCMSVIYFSSLKWTIPLTFMAVPIVFAVLNVIMFKWVKGAVEKSPMRFVNAFMATVTVKLLFTAVVVAVLIVLYPASKAPLALGTFFIYLGVTVILSRALLKIK